MKYLAQSCGVVGAVTRTAPTENRPTLMSHQRPCDKANDSALPSLSRLGAQLLETHYRFDQKRFMVPHPDSAERDAWFLGTQASCLAFTSCIWSGSQWPYNR
jgi:hypothetical protein